MKLPDLNLFEKRVVREMLREQMKKKSKSELTREYKIAQHGLVEALNEAKPLKVEVQEIERKIFDIMTSTIGIELSCLQVRLAELKPKYESALRFAGGCALFISESPIRPRTKKK